MGLARRPCVGRRFPENATSLWKHPTFASSPATTPVASSRPAATAPSWTRCTGCRTSCPTCRSTWTATARQGVSSSPARRTSPSCVRSGGSGAHAPAARRHLRDVGRIGNPQALHPRGPHLPDDVLSQPRRGRGRHRRSRRDVAHGDRGKVGADRRVRLLPGNCVPRSRGRKARPARARPRIRGLRRRRHTAADEGDDHRVVGSGWNGVAVVTPGRGVRDRGCARTRSRSVRTSVGAASCVTRRCGGVADGQARSQTDWRRSPHTGRGAAGSFFGTECHAGGPRL